MAKRVVFNVVPEVGKFYLQEGRVFLGEQVELAFTGLTPNEGHTLRFTLFDEDGVTPLADNSANTEVLDLRGAELRSKYKCRAPKAFRAFLRELDADGVDVGTVDAEGSIVVHWSPFVFDAETGEAATLRGKDGKPGDPGEDGEDGVGIADIAYDHDESNGDRVYSITLTNGVVREFIVPKGEKGEPGRPGYNGAGIDDIRYSRTGDDGSCFYLISTTDGNSYEFKAPIGTKGDTGVGVLNVAYNHDDSDGNKVYNIVLTDGSSFEFVVPKGGKGDKGDKGKEIVDFTFVSEESRFWNYLVNFTDGTSTPIQIPKGEKVELIVEVKLSSGEVATGRKVTIHYGSAEGPIAGEAVIGQYGVIFELTRGREWTAVVSPKFGYLTPDPIQGRADYSDSVVFVSKRYDEVSTFAEVKQAVNVCEGVEGGMGIAKAALIGTVINDVWVDLDATGNGDAEPKADAQNHPRWLDPMVCTDIKEVEDKYGGKHLGAVMMRLYGSRYDISFDAPNQELATEPTAQDGVYYYGFASAYDPSKTYKANNCVKVDGVIYAAKAAITTPEAWNIDHWKVVTSPQNGDSTELLKDLTTGDAIPYSAYDRIYRNSYRDTTQSIITYGHNRYKTSAYRQYLNSSADKGQWWEQKHIGQIKPSQADRYHGYMAGCSDALLAAVKPAKVICDSNYVTDGGSSSDESQEQYIIDTDKFYLPCIAEMFGTSNPAEGEKQFEYWRQVIKDDSVEPNNNNDVINPFRQIRRVTAKTGSAVPLRLRSAHRGHSYYVWGVSTSGNVSGNGASAACASVPACVIY